MSIEPAVPTPLRWLEVPITFSREDQWTSFSEPGQLPLVLKPVVAGSKLNKVLIDGGSGLNVLFTKTLKKMKLDITHMLTKRTPPFYGIVLGNAAIPLAQWFCQLPSGNQGTTTVPSTSSSKSRTSRRPTMPSSADRLSPSPAGVLSLQGDLKISFDCDTEAVELAATNQVPNAMIEIYAASKKLAPSELDISEKSDKANKPQPSEEVLVKTIDLGTGDSRKTTTIGAGLDPK
jgi:hypothetical protein